MTTEEETMTETREPRFVELCETCRDAIREAGGEIAYMPMLRSEALDLVAAAREEGYRAGYTHAIDLLRDRDELWVQRVWDDHDTTTAKLHETSGERYAWHCSCGAAGPTVNHHVEAVGLGLLHTNRMLLDALVDYLAAQAPTTQETTP